MAGIATRKTSYLKCKDREGYHENNEGAKLHRLFQDSQRGYGGKKRGFSQQARELE